MICPRCEQDLDINEFGICRTRKSGHNLYCRSCNRNKTNEARAAKREMIRAHCSARRIQPKEFRSITHRPPEQRVLFAINEGARTQDQIKKKARVFDEELGEALANLILIKGQVVTRINGEEREYFIRAA